MKNAVIFGTMHDKLHFDMDITENRIAHQLAFTIQDVAFFLTGKGSQRQWLYGTEVKW